MFKLSRPNKIHPNGSEVNKYASKLMEEVPEEPNRGGQT